MIRCLIGAAPPPAARGDAEQRRNECRAHNDRSTRRRLVRRWLGTDGTSDAFIPGWAVGSKYDAPTNTESMRCGGSLASAVRSLRVPVTPPPSWSTAQESWKYVLRTVMTALAFGVEGTDPSAASSLGQFT